MAREHADKQDKIGRLSGAFVVCAEFCTFNLLKVSLSHFIWLKVLLRCEHVMKTVVCKGLRQV